MNSTSSSLASFSGKLGISWFCTATHWRADVQSHVVIVVLEFVKWASNVWPTYSQAGWLLHDTEVQCTSFCVQSGWLNYLSRADCKLGVAPEYSKGAKREEEKRYPSTSTVRRQSRNGYMVEYWSQDHFKLFQNGIHRSKTWCWWLFRSVRKSYSEFFKLCSVDLKHPERLLL